MGLDLPSGGHLSHGFYTQKKKISNTSVMFESLPYGVNESGYVDYDKLEEMAVIFKPKLLICGGSAYPRDWDYQRFRTIADSVGAYLMCDMAHISGLVATGEMKSPFPFCDIVTSTTHKTLRGPRSGLIFYRKKYENQINESVFPGTQGGPHQNQIGALAHQLLEVSQPEFKDYIKQVKLNAKVLSDHLKDMGYKIASNGTDSHIVLANVKDKGVTGSKVEKLCEVVDISINKNTIYGDKSPMNPGGIRLGTAAMTTRGFKEAEFKKVAKLINNVVNLAIEIQKKSGPKLVDFNKALEDEPRIQVIKNEVNNLASNYYFPID
jgi:glycine hydroxymethyltransferase